MQMRDDLGLSTDPRSFAKSSCRDCNGKGVFVVTRHLTRKENVKLTQEHPATGVQVAASGGLFKSQVTCHCASKSYTRARAAALAAGVVPVKPEEPVAVEPAAEPTP